MTTHDLIPVKEGRTYKGIKITLPSQPTYSLTGASIYMQVRPDSESDAVASFTLPTLSEYVFTISPQVINIKAGTYMWDVLIIFADGRRKTYVGGNWTILPSITKKP